MTKVCSHGWIHIWCFGIVIIYKTYKSFVKKLVVIDQVAK
jgi:hypothetical protein